LFFGFFFSSLSFFLPMQMQIMSCMAFVLSSFMISSSSFWLNVQKLVLLELSGLYSHCNNDIAIHRLIHFFIRTIFFSYSCRKRHHIRLCFISPTNPGYYTPPSVTVSRSHAHFAWVWRNIYFDFSIPKGHFHYAFNALGFKRLMRVLYHCFLFSYLGLGCCDDCWWFMLR
jgi:hypothetical protein